MEQFGQPILPFAQDTIEGLSCRSHAARIENHAPRRGQRAGLPLHTPWDPILDRYAPNINQPLGLFVQFRQLLHKTFTTELFMRRDDIDPSLLVVFDDLELRI